MSSEPPAYPAAETLCADKDCDRRAWLSCPEGFCLFHSPYNGRLDAAARTIWQTARGMAKAGDCDFRRWHFPPDPDHDLRRGQGGFIGAMFRGDARFENTTFSGDAWFICATFSSNALFSGATFSSEARFSSATFGGHALFNRATFGSRAGFMSATFAGEALFQGTTFSGEVVFASATFDGITRFQELDWKQGIGVHVDTPYRWRNTWSSVHKVYAFVQAVARANHHVMAYLLRSTLNAKLLRGLPGPFRHRRHGESLYRFAKQTAQEYGNYRAAGRYHYAEQCAIEDGYIHFPRSSGFRKRTLLWAALLGIGRLIVGRLVFGYGEKPWHPLLLGLAVILAWALVFACIDGVAPAPESEHTSVVWWQYGYFSVVTFTTLGYGDYQPKQGWPQVLAGVEAALGAALMATFIVCLTRKYMR